MAQAVVELYPGTRFGVGPATETGFFYDFEFPEPITEEELPKIEKRMKEIIRGRHEFRRRVVELEEARQLFAGQPFKLELITGLTEGTLDEDGTLRPAAEDVELSIYEHDTFADLCKGPHVGSTGEIDAQGFKLTHTAGAYWRGDERRPMLTRIYGAAWQNKKELKDYLYRLEESKRRDHRKLGPELEIFATNPLIGAGLPLWLPHGATIRRCLEEYIVGVERRSGYKHLYTPALGKVDLYITSGHWEHYQHDMFPAMEMGEEKLVLRPMNCPHHIVVYQARAHSYRDLPLRLAELGTMYRNERSGVVSGLSRVRCMTLNDAHIFCRPDQIKEEFGKVVKLVEEAYETLGITEYSYRLSLRDPADQVKYVDDPEMWEMGETVLREAMDDLGLEYTVGRGEAAFYGPKLDIQLRDVLGREETVSTIQLDFHLPRQFELSYVGEDSARHRPVIIHRAIVSTMERMIAYLIELYAGAFPPWLAPVQACFVPITDRNIEYAERVAASLVADDLRVEVDASDKRMNAKIRQAQKQKIPYIVVIGDQEQSSEQVAVRLRTGEQLPPMGVDAFHQLLAGVVRSRSAALVPEPSGG
jgi:threonyl-tRNA synthetase